MIYCRLSIPMELTGTTVTVEHTRPNFEGDVTAFITSYGFAGSVKCKLEDVEQTVRDQYPTLVKQDEDALYRNHLQMTGI